MHFFLNSKYYFKTFSYYCYFINITIVLLLFIIDFNGTQMELTYIYHSGFILECESCLIIIDYYKDVNGLVSDIISKYTNCIYFLSSHSHSDHFNLEIFAWKDYKNVKYILSKDILDENPSMKGSAIFMEKFDSYSDENITIKAFGSTDIGISFLIDVDGKSVFHAGDLNNWHWNEESTPDEIFEAELAYSQELDLLKKGTKHVNVAMFPVDPRLGKDYMKGAEQFIDTIKVDLFVPMHFDFEYAKANAFSKYVEDIGGVFWKITGEGQSVLV